MPRDKRLWMTFPIDFWQHPKIAPLSDASFRVFVEINGYSRTHNLDGRVPMKVAHKLWDQDAIAELLRNHEHRPSLSIDGDVYVIWNYSEHQETKATIEAREAKNRANGAKGGRPSKTQTEPNRNPVGFDSETQTEPNANPNRTQPKAESESESEIETSRLSQSGQETLPAEPADKTDQLIPALISEIRHELGIDATTDEARHWARYVIGHAKTPPRNPKSYLLASLYNSRDEQADWFAKHRRHLKAVGNG